MPSKFVESQLARVPDKAFHYRTLKNIRDAMKHAAIRARIAALAEVCAEECGDCAMDIPLVDADEGPWHSDGSVDYPCEAPTARRLLEETIEGVG